MKRAWLMSFHLACVCIASADQPIDPAAGLHENVEFKEYTPLASWAELITRLMSPLSGRRMKLKLIEAGYPPGAQSIDLKRERFTLFVPAVEPAQGFSLLVFLPPWDDARLPTGWSSALEQAGTVFVTARRTGNDQSIMDRREPLMLLAALNVISNYHIDPTHVYVAGFSGGSRVAMRLALAYPDVFTGALLNAGSDPIGDVQTPLPPAALFHRFQSSSRVLYYSGQDDTVNLDKDASSALSMRRWCMFNTTAETLFHQGHEVAAGAALARVLRKLNSPADSNSPSLADCRASIEQLLSVREKLIEAAIAERKFSEAQKLLNALDAHFGGLASPQSEQYQQALDEVVQKSTRPFLPHQT